MTEVYITSSWAVIHHCGEKRHVSFICPICGREYHFDEHGQAQCFEDGIKITVPTKSMSKLLPELEESYIV